MEDTKITIGGRQRAIRLTMSDGAELQERFKFQDAGDWLVGAVLGLPIVGVSGFSLLGRIETVRLALVRAAKSNEKMAFPSTLVSEWLDAAAEDGSLKELLWTVVASAFKAGWPRSKSLDIDTVESKLKALFLSSGELEEDSNAQPVTSSATTVDASA